MKTTQGVNSRWVQDVFSLIGMKLRELSCVFLLFLCVVICVCLFLSFLILFPDL